MSYPERFEQLLDKHQSKTRQFIKDHAQKYIQSLEQKIKRQRIVQTKDWRAVIHDDQNNFGGFVHNFLNKL